MRKSDELPFSMCESSTRSVLFYVRKFDAAIFLCVVFVDVISLCVKVRRIIPSSEALDPINAIFEGLLHIAAVGRVGRVGRCKLNIFILQ